MNRHWRGVALAAAIACGASSLEAQRPFDRDFTRYLDLWETLATELGEPTADRCAAGAAASERWADRHLREVIEIEKRIEDALAGQELETALDTLMAEEIADRFFNALERWFEWGFMCMEDERMVAAEAHVDSLRTTLEIEIFGAAQSRSRMEVDLAALDDPFSKASLLVADGEEAAQSGNIEMALEAFRQATAIDSTFVVSGDSWNQLCWFGSLWGYAREVMSACESAVRESGGETYIIDSRGLARALTGDVVGAIGDFEAYLPDAAPQERAQRQEWIAALKAGKNPFTEAVLRALREQP